MNPFKTLPIRYQTRRQALRQMGTGLGMLGLYGVLGDARLLGTPSGPSGAPSLRASGGPLAVRSPQFPARAKRIIHI